MGQKPKQQATGNEKNGEFLVFLFVGHFEAEWNDDKKHMFWQADKCFRVSMGYLKLFKLRYL